MLQEACGLLPFKMHGEVVRHVVVGETQWWGDLVAWMGGMEEGMKEGGASEWVRNQDALHGVGRGPWCHGNTAIDRRDVWGPLVGHPTSVHTHGGRV